MEIIVNAKIKISEENKEQVGYLVSKLEELNAIDELGGNLLKDIRKIFENKK